MREFYFRAFNKETEVWITNLEELPISFLYGKKSKHIKIMQDTGLRDNNNVKIYEGDIVKCSLGIGYIEYHHSYFRIFKPYVFSVNLINEQNTKELEPNNNVIVIGNIFDNNELLNEKNSLV